MDASIYHTHRAGVPLRIGRENVAAWIRAACPPSGSALYVHPGTVHTALSLLHDVDGVPLLRNSRIPEGRLVLLPEGRTVAPEEKAPILEVAVADLSARAIRIRWAAFGLPPQELALKARVPDRLLVAFFAGRYRFEPWALSRLDAALRVEEAIDAHWEPLDKARRLEDARTAQGDAQRERMHREAVKAGERARTCVEGSHWRED